MKKTYFLVALLTIGMTIANAQEMTDKLPYHQIPDYPEKFTAETVAARMVDGLGFRYHWATEGLTAKDLEYRPSDMARSSRETIEHILGLTTTMVNAIKMQSNERIDYSSMTFEELRAQTLQNIKESSDILRNAKPGSLENYKMKFSKEFPFWNLINGPIADAIWHVGQVVSFRRASGNPYNSKASVFTGKLRE
ncbi:MAG: hypothetical protein JXQ96_16160 [Cyclobacteriaceae bacterium]